MSRVRIGPGRSKSGFSIVELMIVVAIVGLLALMALPAFKKIRRTSQERIITNNLRIISDAAEQYFFEKGVSQVTWTQLYIASDSANSFLKSVPVSVAGENYEGAFATMDHGMTQLAIYSNALGTNVVFNR